ncbi:Na+/H+ antiporter NhaC, partial [Bacillus stratosphericus]
MHPREASLISLLIVAVMGITMIGFGWVPHISIVLVMCGLFAYGRIRGQDFAAMQKSMAEGVVSGIGAIYLFFYIGLLVAALMMWGAFPTLMYYGFDLISTHFFYISAFILCSVIGISLGRGFTT